MGRYILRRLLISIPTLLVISAVLFTILALAPGDPMSQFALNPEVPPEVRERVKASLGLDQPLHIRYAKWIGGIVTGDFGFSFATRGPVTDLIVQRLPNTLLVLGIAYTVSVLIAIPIGIISAVKRYSLFDYGATTLAFIGISVPTFFTGLLLIIIFAVKLKWFPFLYDSRVVVSDLNTLGQQIRQSIMPITVLTLFNAAQLTRYVRAEMLENLPQDYVRTARAKGLHERPVIARHVLRNSLIPVVTLIALGVPTIFTGAIITEQVFGYPGIGTLLIAAVHAGDYSLVLGIASISILAVSVAVLLIDLLYPLLDPRVKLH